MKFLHIELVCGNTTPKQTVSKTSILICIILLIFTVTTAVLKINRYKLPSTAVGDLKEPESLPSTSVKKCDIFSGEWVPNPEAPYYTNTTCWAIHEHQNCMKHGRPDSEFMKWRWKPNECELPMFNPFQFLEIMRGKSMAFVGDSLARNHMQSMICLLSRVSFSYFFKIEILKLWIHNHRLYMVFDYIAKPASECSIFSVFYVSKLLETYVHSCLYFTVP